MQTVDGRKNNVFLSETGNRYEYQYRAMSVNHLADLQENIESLRRDGLLCNSETFQGYLSEMTFSLPEDFPTAQSILIMAVFIRPMVVHFQINGARIPAAMPPNYYDAGLTRQMLHDVIQKNILQENGYRIERTYNRFHMKLLAVRSGLGQYGRNNLCYVDGMGSFLTLHSYLTDYRFATDDWRDLQMMDICKNCTICMKQCPGGAIRADRFVIDVNRCIPLYNEVEGVLPDWIPAEAHNAFLGCMKCQSPCPANREALKQSGQLEDITEEETRQFLSGNPDEAVILSVSKKLKIPYLVGSKEMTAVASRNIKAILSPQT